MMMSLKRSNQLKKLKNQALSNKTKSNQKKLKLNQLKLNPIRISKQKKVKSKLKMPKIKQSQRRKRKNRRLPMKLFKNSEMSLRISKKNLNLSKILAYQSILRVKH